MHRLLALFVLGFIAVGLLAATPARGQVQPSAATRKYPAGWNLVSVPDGTNFPATGSLLTAQPGDSYYEQVPTGGFTTSGFGYWAYLSGGDQSGYAKAVVLGLGNSDPYSVSVPAGQWVLVGDPSGLLPAVIQGADTSLTFDSLHGYQPASILQPGQGAWVDSSSGGVVSVTPLPPAAQSPLPQGGAPAVSTQPPLSISVSTGGGTAANPVMPNPNTAFEPAATWWLGPFPPLPLNPLLSWAPSPPFSSLPICPGYLPTSFSFNYCGSFTGEPVPGNGVPNPFVLP